MCQEYVDDKIYFNSYLDSFFFRAGGEWRKLGDNDPLLEPIFHKARSLMMKRAAKTRKKGKNYTENQKKAGRASALKRWKPDL